jgi:hypothetical protein
MGWSPPSTPFPCDMTAATKGRAQKENVRWYGLHAFRRAFATNLYHKDVKEVTVQVSDGPQERLHDHSRTLHQTAG